MRLPVSSRNQRSASWAAKSGNDYRKTFRCSFDRRNGAPGKTDPTELSPDYRGSQMVRSPSGNLVSEPDPRGIRKGSPGGCLFSIKRSFGSSSGGPFHGRRNAADRGESRRMRRAGLRYLLRVSSLSRRNGWFNSYPRHVVVDHRHGLCVPNVRKRRHFRRQRTVPHSNMTPASCAGDTTVPRKTRLSKAEPAGKHSSANAAMEADVPRSPR